MRARAGAAFHTRANTNDPMIRAASSPNCPFRQPRQEDSAVQNPAHVELDVGAERVARTNGRTRKLPQPRLDSADNLGPDRWRGGLVPLPETQQPGRVVEVDGERRPELLVIQQRW